MNSPNSNNISMNTSSSIQIVASIDDLLIQILLRLLTKSTYRFKSMSKHWKSLTRSPQLRHLRSLVPDSFKGLIYKNGRLVDFHIPQFKHFRKLKFPCETHFDMDIISSCRGLLLCSVRVSFSSSLSGYYICNPTTNTYSKIPVRVDEGGYIKGMCLAFDPSKSPHYRVVCVTIMISTGFYFFSIYSSETSSWRKCGYIVTNGVDFRDGVYCNGAVHWISSSNFGSGESIYLNPDDDYDPTVYK